MIQHVRDNDLLDALEKLAQKPLSGKYWRSVRVGRSPEECVRGGGRWDDGSFDVLYTSASKEGAIEERRFHLFRGQPIPPSKISFALYQVNVSLSNVITFNNLESLRAVGLNIDQYGSLSYAGKDTEYPRSQEIAEACFFLGADGIVVPNARHDSLNLIVFCEQDPKPIIEMTDFVEPINF